MSSPVFPGTCRIIQPVRWSGRSTCVEEDWLASDDERNNLTVPRTDVIFGAGIKPSPHLCSRPRTRGRSFPPARVIPLSCVYRQM